MKLVKEGLKWVETEFVKRLQETSRGTRHFYRHSYRYAYFENLVLLSIWPPLHRSGEERRHNRLGTTGDVSLLFNFIVLHWSQLGNDGLSIWPILFGGGRRWAAALPRSEINGGLGSGRSWICRKHPLEANRFICLECVDVDWGYTGLVSVISVVLWVFKGDFLISNWVMSSTSSFVIGTRFCFFVWNHKTSSI